MSPPLSHGGGLVDRLARVERARGLAARLTDLPQSDIERAEATDVMNTATGAFSPLEDYLGRAARG
ncbi:MAG: hypothetical protein HY727_04670 [Candidatus Rokubacteria bacterium]|nr:hypothetical protein [Candidatus Rokubacteria bacterium]